MNCKNCGCSDLQPLYVAPAFDCVDSNAKYTISRCKSCQLVNTLEVDAETVGSSYTNEYYGSGSNKFIMLIEVILSKIKLNFAHQLISFWRERHDSAACPTVLDIGCGRGQLLSAFKNLGANVLGLERNEFPVDDALVNFVRNASIADAEFVGKKFDIIILWHVLEHLDCHTELIKELKRHLNPDGLLVLAIPNFDSLQQKVFKKYWFHLDLPRHLVHIESKWIIKQLSINGFDVKKESYSDVTQNYYGFIQSVFNSVIRTRPNHYYRLLKTGWKFKNIVNISFLSYTFLSVILLPIAIIENIMGGLLRRGATVQIISRIERT